MKALKFILSGKNAFFKKPEVNTYVYFTYGNIHKVALLGIFGAILGHGGYIQMKKNDEFPEFYKKLNHLKLAICPNSKEGGTFGRKIQVFNNSVGYASGESGGNLIVKQQWLDNPSWTIYLLLDCPEADHIKDCILSNRCVYIPYLGGNSHPANILSAEMVECNFPIFIKDTKLSSLFDKDVVEYDIDNIEDEMPFIYSECLPIALEENTNMYIHKHFEYTNLAIDRVDNAALMSDGKIVVFI